MGKFVKTVEDFACEKCGTKTQGDGFTNHCPFCLWSKHVDIYPGDRQEKCKGLMEPVGLDQKNGGFVLIHKCIKCGKKKRNKISPKDDQEKIRKILVLQNSNL